MKHVSVNDYIFTEVNYVTILILLYIILVLFPSKIFNLIYFNIFMTEVPIARGTRFLSSCARVLSVNFVTDEQTETCSNNCTPGLSSIKHMIEFSQGVHLCFTLPKLV